MFLSLFSKLFIEDICRDVQRGDPEWRIIMLRYFNPVGAHPSGRIGEDPCGTPNNLMPYVQQVVVGRLPNLKIYGTDYTTKDGTGVRLLHPFTINISFKSVHHSYYILDLMALSHGSCNFEFFIH